MTGRERIMRILNRQETDRSGYWMGNPSKEALEIYLKHFKCKNQNELSLLMGDDLTWILSESYEHPKGFPMWDTLGGKQRVSHSQNGVFCDTENVDDILNYDRWPDIKYFNAKVFEKDFVRAKKQARAVFSGTWTAVWHLLMDFFGMESCFIKMYTNPDVVMAVMEKMTAFYLEANKIIFEKYGEYIDVFFFGNDMGSQLDCMISPEMFRELIFPFYRQLIDLAKSYDKKVALHSCGAIDKIIPDIIDMGVDVLHPIQARAAGMQAENLQKKYGGQIVFLGGVDTQDLLPFGEPAAVAAEVQRLREIFGEHYICSPSHEALLQNVSPQNLEAMSRAATQTL